MELPPFFEVGKFRLTQSLQCSLGKIESLLIFSLLGDLDAYSEERFTALANKFCQDVYSNIIVDMTYTRFCDSSGLMCLAQLNAKCTNESGSLALIPNSEILDSMKATALVDYFSIYPDIFAAATSFNSDSAVINKTDSNEDFDEKVLCIISFIKKASTSRVACTNEDINAIQLMPATKSLLRNTNIDEVLDSWSKAVGRSEDAKDKMRNSKIDRANSWTTKKKSNDIDANKPSSYSQSNKTSKLYPKPKITTDNASKERSYDSKLTSENTHLSPSTIKPVTYESNKLLGVFCLLIGLPCLILFALVTNDAQSASSIENYQLVSVYLFLGLIAIMGILLCTPNTFQATVHDTHLEIVQFGGNPVIIKWNNITRIMLTSYNFQDLGIAAYHEEKSKRRSRNQSIFGIGNMRGLYREIKRLVKKNAPDGSDFQESNTWGFVITWNK